MKITKFLNIDIEPAPPEMELQIEMQCREIMQSNDLDNIRIQLDADQLPVFKEINAIVKAAQKIAEARLIAENPELGISINFQQEVKGSMQAGDVDRAHQLQKKESEKRKLLNYGGSR